MLRKDKQFCETHRNPPKNESENIRATLVDILSSDPPISIYIELSFSFNVYF